MFYIVAHGNPESRWLGRTVGNEIDDISIEPVPTRRELLKAISTIEKYIDGPNDSLAHKIDVVSGSFTRKDSTLTDFSETIDLISILAQIYNSNIFSDVKFVCDFLNLFIAYPTHNPSLKTHSLGRPREG